MTKIVAVESFDVRFPTSKMLDGSDAMNQDPDYSAAYLRITTDKAGLHGDSLVFTIGRGNDVHRWSQYFRCQPHHRGWALAGERCRGGKILPRHALDHGPEQVGELTRSIAGGAPG